MDTIPEDSAQPTATPNEQYKDNILAEEQRYVVKTANGIIDQDMVGKYKVAHDEA